MAKVFDIRLAPYADQLTAIIGGHADLQQEYEDKRRIFNAQFRKIMFMQIRPVVQDLLDLAARKGHWVEIHTLMDERYRVHLHQCYSIHWRTGGKADLAVVGNYDYKKVFFIVEQDGQIHQLDLALEQIHQEALAAWFSSIFPTL